MQYKSILGPLEISQHIEQSHSIWGGSSDIMDRQKLLMEMLNDCGIGLFHLSGLVDNDGKLLSSLKRYYFNLNVKGQKHRCVGLGAIFTHQGMQKKGLADQLIRSVLKESYQKNECHYALLFSDIGKKYYEKFGFRATLASNFCLLTKNLPDARPLFFRVADKNDLKSMLDYYQTVTSKSAVCCRRESTTWEFFRHLNNVQQDLILDHANETCGFVSISCPENKDYLWLEEWMAPPHLEDAVWATLKKICLDQNIKEVRGWHLPHYLKLKSENLSQRDNAIPMIAYLNDGEGLNEHDLEKSYFSSPDHF